MAARRSEPYTYLHADATIRGEMTVEGRVRIDGTVRGSIRAGGVVEVAPGGRVEGGPVHGSDVRVAGTVVGEVHASGRVEIWRGGTVDGDVHADSLDVERGARFRGRSVMHDDEAPSASAITSAAAVQNGPDEASANDAAGLAPAPLT